MDSANLDFISKITQNANSDLRQYTARVKADLSSLQAESVTEISSLSAQVATLSKEIDNSLSVLDKIGNIVGTFQVDLQTISTQVLALQDQSNQMNVSHKNRKALYDELDGFLKSLLVSPQYIEYLRVEDINEEYISKIGKLDTVLKNLRNYSAMEEGRSQAVQEIKPELEKVNAMVCARLETLITSKIQTLSKPKTNLQVIQDNVLKKYAPLMVFLRNHNQQVYVKLTTLYSDTMRRVYFALFKSYISDSSKLIQEIVTSHDLIGITGPNDDPAGIRVAPSSSKGLRVRGFLCDGGDNILKEIAADPIVVYVSAASKNKHNVEQIFRSQNRLFINTITAEIVFLCQFFSLRVQQCAHIFKQLFNDVVTHYLSWLKGYLGNNNDCCGIFLMILVNQLNKQQLEQKQFPILQFYFDKLSQTLWPRFTQVFQNQLNSLKKANMHILSVTEKQQTKAGPGGRANLIPPNVVLPLVMQYVQFVRPLYYLGETRSFEMLSLRLKQLKAMVVDAVKEIGDKLFKHDKNVAAVFMLNNAHFIRTKLQGVKSGVLAEDLKEMQRQNGQRVDSFMQGLVGGYFHELVGVVKKYAAQSLNDSGSDSDRPSYEKGEDTKSEDEDGEEPFRSAKNEKLGQSQLAKMEEVDSQFQTTWRGIMGEIEDYLGKTVVSGSGIDKEILKGVAKLVFRNYTIFADLLKSSGGSSVSAMQAQKSALVELKNYERQIK